MVVVVVSLSLRAVHGVVNGQWLLAAIASKRGRVGMVPGVRRDVERVMLWTMHRPHVTFALSWSLRCWLHPA